MAQGKFKEDGFYYVKEAEADDTDKAIIAAQIEKQEPLTQGEYLALLQGGPNAPQATEGTYRRNLAERFSDAFDLSSSEGGRGENAYLARRLNDAMDNIDRSQFVRNPNLTAEQLEARRDAARLNKALALREEADYKDELDPAFREDRDVYSGLAHFGAEMAGDLKGNLNPTLLLGAGKSILGRMLFQGGVNAGLDASVQGGEIGEGLRENFNPTQTGVQFLLGAGLQGGGEAVGRFLKGSDDFIDADKLDLEGSTVDDIIKGFDVQEIWDGVPADIKNSVQTFSGVGRDRQGEFLQFRKEDGATVKLYGQPLREGDKVKGTKIEVDTSTIEPDEVVKKLTSELEQAKTLNKEQQNIYRQERRERLEELRIRQARGDGGEASFQQEKAALAGEFEKVEFEGVREKFSQDEIDSLFKKIKDNETFGTNVFASINARTGLAKLLEGKIPTKSELTYLQEVFPPDFVKAALDKRSGARKFIDGAANALNIPRALMSSIDLSAPLRQGVVLIGRKEWYTAAASMFKQMGSEKAFNAVEAEIKARPSYKLMQKNGLSLTERDGLDLSKREEDFQTDLAKRIPILGKGVAMSERAYVGFLNKLRADTFDSMVNDIRKTGVDVEKDPALLEGIASYINNATGRGSLGLKTLEESTPILNATFFSPRLIASRFNLLANPVYYAKLPKQVRVQALRDMITFGSVAATATGLASTMGADIETDPRSSDFGKLRYGTKRHDILGGFGQFVTLGARLGTQSSKTIKGEVKEFGEAGPYSSSTGDVTARFFRSKLSPLASFAVDAAYGENVIGEEFELRKAALERVTPFFVSDLAEAMNKEGIQGVPAVLPSAFGIGYSDFDQVPLETRILDQEDPLIQQLEAKEALPSLSLSKNFKIDGKDYSPTDEEMEQYRAISEQIILERAEKMLDNEEFLSLPEKTQTEFLKKMQETTRKEVRSNLFSLEAAQKKLKNLEEARKNER